MSRIDEHSNEEISSIGDNDFMARRRLTSLTLAVRASVAKSNEVDS